MKKIKKVAAYIDQLLFDGEIKRKYKLFQEKKKKSFFNKKKTAIVKEPVSDIILMQYNKNSYMQYEFFDLAVRWLAIDEYFGNNEIGFSLYKKMHTLGGNYGQENKTEDYYEKRRRKKKTVHYGVLREEHSIEQFKNLIQSFEKHGYDERSVIMSDVNMLNMNGSHRLALALYRNQEFINVEVHNLEFKRRFNLDWFWQVGFTTDEIKLIKNKTEELITQCKEKLGNFYCILYPAAYEYFDDITNDIKLFEPDNIKIVGYKEVFLNETEFTGLIHTIYSFDSILPNNLERKLFYILQSAVRIKGKLPIRILEIYIENPIFRLKSDNGLPECINTVRLKEAIRGRYKVKDDKFTKHYVGDYAHDVIIHSTDNYLSNYATKVLLELNMNLIELFIKLNEYDYCIVETSEDKISVDFPATFYLNDDIDIFVKKQDIEQISNLIETFCTSHFVNSWVEVQNIESQNGRRVKVLMQGCLIVMFDLMYKMPELKEDYIFKMISRRRYNNFYHLCYNDEITVRLAKYVENRAKKWHADYIKSKAKEYKMDEEAFINPKKIKKLYEEISCTVNGGKNGKD